MITSPVQWNPAEETLEIFKQKYGAKEVVDAYNELLEELFLIRNPRYKIEKNYTEPLGIFKNEHFEGKSPADAGNWFLFPWSGKLVHYLPDELHQELRTARNKNIITAEEQKKLYNYTVGIAGLSVGSHAALTLSLMGMCKHIKLADPDTISGSNLNRIRYDYTVVGKRKTAIAREYIYQMNPYATVEEFEEGITPESMADFFEGNKKIDLLIEEMDHLGMKIAIRLEARSRGIPVVMATDNGDGVIIDVERFDLEPEAKLFNGAVGDITLEEFQKVQPQDMPKLATKIVGPSYVVPRMLQSLLEVGRTLYSWPQLGDAATLAGVSVAYVVKRIGLGQKIKTGKLEVNLDSIFDPDYHTDSAKQERKNVLDSFLKTIGLE